MARKEKINEERTMVHKIWRRHRNMAGPVPSVFRSFQKDDKMCLVGKIVTKNDV